MPCSALVEAWPKEIVAATGRPLISTRPFQADDVLMDREVCKARRQTKFTLKRDVPTSATPPVPNPVPDKLAKNLKAMVLHYDMRRPVDVRVNDSGVWTEAAELEETLARKRGLVVALWRALLFARATRLEIDGQPPREGWIRHAPDPVLPREYAVNAAIVSEAFGHLLVDTAEHTLGEPGRMLRTGAPRDALLRDGPN